MKTERLLSKNNPELRISDGAWQKPENVVKEMCYTRGFQQGIVIVAQEMERLKHYRISLSALREINFIAHKMRYRRDGKSYYWYGDTFRHKIKGIIKEDTE